MNDRALRHIVIGLGGRPQGIPRESGFDITAASEVMAILCLADSPADLRTRLDRILVGFTKDGEPVLAKQIRVVGSMAAILNEAILPNLVQTTESVPAFIHGGPFANIAHGCNSVVATRMALVLADYAVTEAGFAFDLGGEKFFDLKCRTAGLNPAAVVIVATIRALKMHGGVPLGETADPDPGAVERGLVNLAAHLDSAAHFGKPVIVAVNQFTSDTPAELSLVHSYCAEPRRPLRHGQRIRCRRPRSRRTGRESRCGHCGAREPAQNALSLELACRAEDCGDCPCDVWRLEREHPARG